MLQPTIPPPMMSVSAVLDHLCERLAKDIAIFEHFKEMHSSSFQGESAKPSKCSFSTKASFSGQNEFSASFREPETERSAETSTELRFSPTYVDESVFLESLCWSSTEVRFLLKAVIRP